jgi:hypothetical protein
MLARRSSGEPICTSVRRAKEAGVKAEATRLQAVETDLRQLMADVSRAMAKAEDALARIGGKAATPITETAATSMQ